jgi:hypothetical protein
MLDSRILTCSPTQSKKGLAMVTPRDRLNAVQSAWDALETLPPIEFSQAEADSLYRALSGEGLERAAVIAESLPGVPPPPRSIVSFGAARANQCELVATAIRAEKDRSNGVSEWNMLAVRSKAWPGY